MTAVTATAVIALGLSGCGSGGSNNAGGPPGSTATSGNTKITKPAPTCDLFPASMVNAALGTNVGEAAAQNLNLVVVCRYSPVAGSRGNVILRVEMNMSQATFTTSRAMSDANHIPTKDLPGFEDMAYTSVLSGLGVTTNTVVALKGSTEILVSSPGSFDQEKTLIEQAYAKLG